MYDAYHFFGLATSHAIDNQKIAYHEDFPCVLSTRVRQTNLVVGCLVDVLNAARIRVD